jgi:hypothetical protein
MTIEDDEMPPLEGAGDPSAVYVVWLTKRMMRFHTEARRYAIFADKRRATYHEHIGKGTFMGTVIPDAFAADELCNNDHLFKKYISGQQMYDRWAMREAAILQAWVIAENYLAGRDVPMIVRQAVAEAFAKK